VKPFLAGTLEKWLFGMGTVKMVTNGGPQMHLQMAPLVSKHWGAPQPIFLEKTIHSIY
jgi:hypothetical protein